MSEVRSQLTRPLTRRTAPAAVVALVASTLVLFAQPMPPVVWRAPVAGVDHAQVVRNVDASGKPGPWTINLLRLDPARVRLDVVHALDEGVGLEATSSIAERHGAIAAVNGGYFRTAGTFRGDSTGTLQIDGRLLSEPDRGRAAVGLVRDKNTTRLVFGHVTWQGVVDAGGKKRRLDGINRARGKDELVLFTMGFHKTTLTDASGTEFVVRKDRVDQVRENAGSSPIPSDGFVLSATGATRQWARETLRPRTRVRVTATLMPVALQQAEGDPELRRRVDRSPANPWLAAEDIVGAGPKLVTAGRVDITTEREKMLPSFATDRHPRTAIATLADGRVLLAVVDGRQPALSIGMSLEELARLLIEFGAVEAINLDGGGSTTMVLQGNVVNHPSDPTGERPVSDAIIVRKGW